MAADEEKELKTIKFQMMLSPGEAKDIDDWSFANRIRSRAEAIRRLCQIAMIFDENSDRLGEHVLALYNDFGDRAEKVAQLLETLPAGDNAVSEFAARAMGLIIDTVERQQYLLQQTALALVPASRFKTEASFDDARIRALADKANHTAQFLETKVKMFETRKKYERKKD